jgi:mono/diheme cytochrome c family protein
MTRTRLVGGRAALGAAVMVVAMTAAAAAQAPARFGIGRPATTQEIAAIDIDIMPDGRGLPPGRGTSADGAAIYATKCAQCHGKTGKEGPNDILVGREPRTGFPFSQDPKLPHTIGNYWPYATTVFDYVRRAMPPTAPGSLGDDEVYALTAFLLHANELIGADAVMDRTTLAAVKMPAREHFVPDTRNQTAKPTRPKP